MDRNSTSEAQEMIMARKGQFKKGGGRVGGGSTAIVHKPRKRKHKAAHHARSMVRSGGGGSVVVIEERKAKRKGGKRRGGGAHGITPLKVLGTGIVLANVAGSKTGPLGETVYNLVQKIPGSKTFGGTATAGLALGGLYKFTKIGGRLRPLLACAGLVGLAAAAIKIGESGTSFKWLGDPDGYGSSDVMDVDD
jgi:hypothetical protein